MIPNAREVRLTPKVRKVLEARCRAPSRLVAAFPDRQLHVILDNLNTHKKNERWLKTLESPLPLHSDGIIMAPTKSRFGFPSSKASH